MRLVLAVNKADLLPAQATARRLEVCPAHTCVLSDTLQLQSSDSGAEAPPGRCGLERQVGKLSKIWAAQAWIRRRAKQGGMPRPEAVRLVSALRGTGVDELLIQLHREVGTNGDVWVVRCHAPLTC